MTNIVLVRHAAAAGQEPEAELTEAGRVQAAVLADLLSELGVERVVSSPFARALDSVAPFCECKGISPVKDVRLVERLLSPTDLPDWKNHLVRSFDEPDYALPGGESAADATSRGVSALMDAAASGTRCALITHGNLLALMLQSIDSRVGFDAWASLSNPDVFLVEASKGVPVGFVRVWPAQ